MPDYTKLIRTTQRRREPIQWRKQGAHYLLQARTTALNGDLPKQFEQWYLGLKISEQSEKILETLKEAA